MLEQPADQKVIIPVLYGVPALSAASMVIPVPVPAVAAIAAKHELPFASQRARGICHPTGAAIAAVRLPQLPERFVIEKTGIGAGRENTNGQVF